MKRMSQKALAIVLYTLAATPVLAQTEAKPSKPIILPPSYPEITAEGRAFRPDSSSSGRDSLVSIYTSRIHAVALQGISLTDSAAVKALIVKQITDLRSDKARAPLSDTVNVTHKRMVDAWMVQNMPEHALRNREYKTAEHKVLQFDAEFFRKRMPDLRAVLPSGQQATFDQNIRALVESGYLLFNNEGGTMALYQYHEERRPKK